MITRVGCAVGNGYNVRKMTFRVRGTTVAKVVAMTTPSMVPTKAFGNATKVTSRHKNVSIQLLDRIYLNRIGA